MKLVIYRWFKGDDCLVVNVRSAYDLWKLASRVMRTDIDVSKIYVETEDREVALLKRVCRFRYEYELMTIAE